MAGEIRKPGKLKIGYFAQFQTEELDVSLTPFEIMSAATNEPSEAKVRAILGGFGFDKAKADTRVGELSGGEKARLLFCLMSFDAPHVMLLDEPTNHLDIDAREALIQALNDYSGVVILVSHDPHLVKCVADQLWLVADGACKPYDDDLDAYRALVLRQRRIDRDKPKKPARETPQASADSKKDAEKWERALADLAARKHLLEGEIAACYDGHDAERLKKLNDAYAALQNETDAAEKELAKAIEEL